jgi:enamine deaminase RidA (YjgF/YER057c/UK114 family)
MVNETVKHIAEEQEICSFLPLVDGDFAKQIESCYAQLKSHLLANNLSDNFVLKQSVFVYALNNKDFSEIKNKLISISDKFFGHFVPISVVPQSPLPEKLVCTEFLIFKNKSYAIERKSFGDIKYLVTRYKDFTQVVASGLHAERSQTDIYQQSVAAFEIMQKILIAEGLSFSNVVRQWNYIEDITGFAGENQHYQIFNDVRSSYYNSSKFTNGYPAATGIGMNSGGVIIDFVANNVNNVTQSISIKSPVQSDAHQYTQEVLAHNAIRTATTESTPKFERAKALASNSENLTIFISGTASIKGQQSVFSNDAIMQTKFTINNILKLVSKENIEKHNLSKFYTSLRPFYFRVYIKNPADFEAVKKVCNEMLGTMQLLYLQADICRPELLIEIEGMFVSEI